MKDLDKFKNEMNLSGKNVYVGHRYKPKMFGEWDNTQIYEPLSIVQYQGASYTSRQYVPAGVELTNEEYWSVTGNYNAQVEQYRQDVRNLESDVNNVNNEVISARNGKANLKVRLDKDQQEVTEQLAENDQQIRKRSVLVSDYGAVGDGVTNDYEAIVKAINSGAIIIFEENKEYLIESTIVISSEVEILLNNSSIIAKGCNAMQIDANYTSYPTIRNGKIIELESAKKFIGVEIRRQAWGAKGIFDNVIIEGFKIGVKTVTAFQVQLKNVQILRCGIGLYLTQDTFFSNVMSFDMCTIMYNDYGVVLDYVRNVDFTSLVLEFNKVALVIKDYSSNVTFTSTWFERNYESNIELGTVNEETLVLTKNKLISYGLTRRGITFKNTRFSSDGVDYSGDLFPKEHRFLNMYGNYNASDKYADNIEALLISGIGYINISDMSNLEMRSDSGSMSTVRKNTPFGMKTVCEGINIIGGSPRAVTYSRANLFKKDHLYLLKSKIKTNKMVNVDMRILDQNEVTLSTHTVGGDRMGTVKGGWVEISEIVQLEHDINTHNAYVSLFLNHDNVAGLNAEVTDIFAVDLTEIFGAGNEPGSYLSKEIGKYFTYTDFKQMAYTGNGYIMESKGESHLRPTSPRTGQLFFDTLLGKPIWWNSVDWVDSSGTTV